MAIVSITLDQSTYSSGLFLSWVPSTPRPSLGNELSASGEEIFLDNMNWTVSQFSSNRFNLNLTTSSTAASNTNAELSSKWK